MRSYLPLALALVPSLALAAPKGAPAADKKPTGPKATVPSACGAKILPLAEGNEWTYAATASPLPPTDQIKRLSPAEPKTIVITVKKIDAQKGKDTVITLSEKITTDLTKDEKKPLIDEHTIETTITCNDKNKFEISPDSFFFAGEPGGYYGMKIDSIERPKGTSWTLTKGGIGDAEWREDLVIHWTRVPTEGSGAKLGSGKVELERRFTPQQPENIIAKAGTFKAEKLGLVTTGRVTLDNASPDMKPMELPAGWISTIWLTDSVGVVQVLNSYSHMYQLVDAKLK